MNKTFNLYDLKSSRAVGSDLVTPWIDDLLDKKNPVETERSAVILSYPVDRLLTPDKDVPVVSVPAKALDIHIVPSANKAGNAVSPVFSVKQEFKLEPEREVSYFTFVSGSSFYALPSLNINEIIKYKTPVNIFSKKAGHLGIILYRNRMVPVYDFSIIVNGAMDTKSLLKYIVICIYENKFFGLSISEIKNITNIKNKNLIPSSSFKFKNSNNITTGVFENAEGKFYSVINIESIFNYLTS
ncbi:MAG: chemotaxis protein CheW [Deltaproteobacteria bacterium]|nr:chemotaxis protein CheW [Deltaproteobacteria bacterium]